jgi:hypothetical protein
MKASLILGTLAVVGALAVVTPVSAHQRHEGPRYGQPHHWGMDVAPGGGYYTRYDVANESPRRMSHPVVGEPRAPSAVARGPHTFVNRFEMGMTAALNLRELHKYGW